ncbi:WecB/TagA/CpsF family glycosyltransferase [Kordiimonas laminariae]|uniref:WecB/TagA/CpsF family glycosyltransferase n=1 Tax=Kordiimonas laminariae TaxID=2917717 RepID=UPI001FF11B1C|nr:WecB/TagA/CpsF family glycosyltransferase [Kordiimonas laminariae]MCK0070286.1 WecB/TagA/CpsF family glycosyltransferase [Kordiimonas laminariae]
MINHYINLVCWHSIWNNYDPTRDHFWIDSISLKALSMMYNRSTIYLPGTHVVSHINDLVISKKEWFFFTAVQIENIPDDSQYELPLALTMEVSEDIKSTLLNIPPKTKVAIGISAPKQNFFATELYKIRPDLEYHCLGAAISKLASKPSQKLKLSKSGFEWLYFLVTSPKRTFQKLQYTFQALLKILFNKDYRIKFKHFIVICKSTEKRSSN